MEHNIARELLAKHRDFVDARPLVQVEGLSSPRVCNFLNRLVAALEPAECYLEVGTYRGLTLLSAAIGNRGRLCVGCDKFRLYGRYTGLGIEAKRALMRNIERYRQSTAEIEFHHTTARRLFARHGVRLPVGVYFYDGDHSYEGTYHGVTAVVPYLARRAVVLVDDWNDPVIQRATYDALREAPVTTLWERVLFGSHDLEGWWNGLAVFFVERADVSVVAAVDALPQPAQRASEVAGPELLEGDGLEGVG
jgi:hypothetical protein